jgi:hypothetical protein
MPIRAGLLFSIRAILLGKRKGNYMRKTKDREQPPVQGRVLARVLADEILRIPGGGLGPTTVVTGDNEDMTNQKNDNDGPHVPPPV